MTIFKDKLMAAPATNVTRHSIAFVNELQFRKIFSDAKAEVRNDYSVKKMRMKSPLV